MPRYRSKPREITAIQFRGSMPLTAIPARIESGGTLGWRVWNARNNEWIEFQEGAFICFDDQDNNYPISEELMRNSYEPVSSGPVRPWD